MTNKKAVAIKLEQTGDTLFEREAFYGLGPFKAKINDDDTLTIGIPNQEVEVCPAQENDYGTYYVFNMYGGKAFASVVEHEQYGTYMRLRLGDNVELPKSVTDKLSGGRSSGGKKSFNNKKSFSNKKTSSAKTNLWS